MTAKITLTLGLVLVTSVTGRAGFLSALFPTDFQVVTNTDVVEKNWRAPSRTAPVYYLPVAAGFRSLGLPVAGEKMPKAENVTSIVTHVLAPEGYQVATPEHPPTLLIVYGWGTLNPNQDFSSFRTATGEMVFWKNSVQALNFMGAYKVGLNTAHGAREYRTSTLGLTSLSSEGATLNGLSEENLYMLTLSAYDFALAQKGQAKLLWKTNISTPSTGHYLPEVIPTMLAIAGPHIGRETSKPILVDVGNQFVPNVEIGPMKEVKD